MSNPFTFGQPPASSGSSSGSLFGTSTGATPFGSNPATTAASGNSSSGATAGSLFSTAPQPSTGGNIFGGASFSFGNPAANVPKESSPSSSTAATAGGIFGTSSGPGSGSSIFGSTTPAANKTSPFAFGNPSTTPAGPPPPQSTFGASTGGGANPPSTTAGGSNIFGNTSNAGAVTGFSPFGQPKPNTGPASASAPGGAEAPKPTFSFGNPAAPNPAAQNTSEPISQPGGSIFSSANATPGDKSAPKAPAFSFPSGPASSSAAPNTNLFGAAPTSSSAPFGPSLATSAEAPKPMFAFPTPASTSVSAEPPKAGFPGSSAPPSTSAEAPKSPFSGFSLGGPASTSSVTPASTASAPSAPTLAPFGGLGAPKSTAPASSTAATAGPTSTISAPPAGLSASTAGPVPPAQSRLKNKTMDEILTRWASDLTKYTKEFRTHAETVAHWDQMVVENMAKITKLYSTTFVSEKQTESVDMQLSAVESQQNELEALLTSYESVVDDMLKKDGPSQVEMGGPDQERERTYKLAEKLGERLDDMGRDLESMIQEINSANSTLSKNIKADEPITQIVRILNSHLTQLHGIDQGTVILQGKVAAAQKSAATLGYFNGGGNGGAAVDDFYRSYMGRR